MNLQRKNKMIKLAEDMISERFGEFMTNKNVIKSHYVKETKLIAERIANDPLVIALNNLIEELKKV